MYKKEKTTAFWTFTAAKISNTTVEKKNLSLIIRNSKIKCIQKIMLSLKPNDEYRNNEGITKIQHSKKILSFDFI